MPKVTVVIPTYNWSTVLPYSVKSVRHQTMQDFELFVVGDGCTDNTAEVMQEICAQDSRVRWHNLPENAGDQAVPNQWALENSDSPIVSYLNHDDLYMPHALEAMLATINAGADFAHGCCAMVSGNGDLRLGSGGTNHFQANQWWMTPSCVMHRRQAGLDAGGWKPSEQCGRYAQQDFWVRLRNQGSKFAFVPRLVSVKFSAATRKNVYKDRPFHEQEEYVRRIQNESNFEAEMLAQLIMSNADVEVSAAIQRQTFRDHWKALKEIAFAKLTRKFSKRPRETFAQKNQQRKKFKGLPDKKS